MQKRCVVLVKELQNERVLLWTIQAEYIVTHKLVNQILPQLWADLEGVHAQIKEDFDHTASIVNRLGLVQFLNMLLHHRLREELCPVATAL